MLLHSLIAPVRAGGVLGTDVPHGPEYICLAGILVVMMLIVVISFYFGFWGRK